MDAAQERLPRVVSRTHTATFAPAQAGRANAYIKRPPRPCMPGTYTADRVREMAESGICEPSRLMHILRMMSAGRPLYNSDIAYLDRIAARLSGKEADLRRENQRIRRVLGSGLGGAPAPVESGAPAQADVAARAPHVNVPAARPVARAAPALTTPARHSVHTERREKGRQPSNPPQAPSSPAKAEAAPLVDGDLLDAILERRERKRRSSARETTAAAAAAATGATHAAEPALSSPAAPAAAEPPSPQRAGSLARRLRGIAAGRR